MKIGVQVSSLKPLLQTPPQTAHAFSRLKALGCDTVQLQWIDPSVPAGFVAEALRGNGIVSVSVQELYETVRENPSYFVQLNALTGGKWLCVSRIPERLKSPDGLGQLVQELRQMQKMLDPYGQILCFHPVSGDFAAIPGRNAVAELLEAMPELTLCLDLYHLGRNCPDMPGFIRRYAGRICMVHFKDAKGSTLVPAGQGDICWDGVVQACLEAEVPYAFVEQERWDQDPYRCLREATNWLEAEICQETSEMPTFR